VAEKQTDLEIERLSRMTNELNRPTDQKDIQKRQINRQSRYIT